MSGRKSSFETLDCWKEARALKIFIRKEIRPKLPKHEQFDLDGRLDQLRPTSRKDMDAITIWMKRNFLVTLEAPHMKCLII
jgi:hypothetical protein